MTLPLPLPALSPIACTVVLLAGLPAGRAAATPVEVVCGIAAQAPASPKSLVPGGLPGVTDAQFTNFNNKLSRTPTTGRWIAVPTVQSTSTASDQVLLVGQGLSSQVAAQEGVTEFTPGKFINFSRLDVPRFNDQGQWAMAFRLNVSGSSTADEQAIRWNGSSFDIVVAAGSPVVPSPGDMFVGNINSACISQSGAVSFQGQGGFEPSDSAYLADGATRVAQIGVTAPSNLSPGSAGAPWSDIDTNTFISDATGAHWIALGEVAATDDKVAVINGAVVVQKNVFIPGSGFASPVNTIADVWMEPNGDWFVRGANSDGIDWVIRNGQVIAAENRPIIPGSTEVWESFRSGRSDNRGDWVVSGNTRNAETLLDDVVVFSGKRILARESDGVDLDGNGVNDDGLFLHLIQDHGTLPGDGYYYFASRLKSDPGATSGAGGSNNASLLRVRACRADIDGSGSVSVQDIFDFLDAYFTGSPLADTNNVGGLTVQDIFDFVDAFFAGC